MSIEEKTKEYILKELIPNLGFDIHLEPIVASYVVYKADTSFRAGAEWILEKAMDWLNDKVMFDEVGRPVKIEQFKQVMEE